MIASPVQRTAVASDRSLVRMSFANGATDSFSVLGWHFCRKAWHFVDFSAFFIRKQAPSDFDPVAMRGLVGNFHLGNGRQITYPGPTCELITNFNLYKCAWLLIYDFFFKSQALIAPGFWNRSISNPRLPKPGFLTPHRHVILVGPTTCVCVSHDPVKSFHCFPPPSPAPTCSFSSCTPAFYTVSPHMAARCH